MKFLRLAKNILYFIIIWLGLNTFFDWHFYDSRKDLCDHGLVGLPDWISIGGTLACMGGHGISWQYKPWQDVTHGAPR